MSCVCGHVFTAKKLIGGKRFSTYRAQLYSRIEGKRGKSFSVKENRPAKLNCTAAENGLVTTKKKKPGSSQALRLRNSKAIQTNKVPGSHSNRVPACHSNRIPVYHSNRVLASHSNRVQAFQSSSPLRIVEMKTSLRSKASNTCCGKHRKTNYARTIPREIVERFPRALAEINRRLVSQSFIWTSLSNE